MVFVLFIWLFAYRAASALPAESARAYHDAYFLANNATGFSTMACVGLFSAALWRMRVLPRWVPALGGLVVAVHAVSAGALALDGPFQPDAFWGYAAPTLMTLWVLAVAISAQRLRSH